MSSSYCKLLYHIVFSTKERRPLITDRLQTELHHRRRSFQDEFLELLEKNEVIFDPKYLWE